MELSRIVPETGTTGGEQIVGPPFPPVSSFTVTFQEPGTYPYYCAIHPWMGGEVIGQGQNQTETLGQNQTETLGQNQTETLGQNEAEPTNPILSIARGALFCSAAS